MKSIRTKITLCLILTVLVSLVASGASSILLNYNSTISTVEQMMTETAVLAAGRAQQELLAYKNAVMEIGCIPELADSDVPVEKKRAIIDDRVAMHEFQRETSSVRTVSVFLMERIILTASMYDRPFRVMSMCRSR